MVKVTDKGTHLPYSRKTYMKGRGPHLLTMSDTGLVPVSRGFADAGILSLNLPANATTSSDHLSPSFDAIQRVRGRAVAGPASMLATAGTFANITASPSHPDRAKGLKRLETPSRHDNIFFEYYMNACMFGSSEICTSGKWLRL